MKMATFSRTISIGNIIATLVPIITVVGFVIKLDSGLERQIEVNEAQDRLLQSHSDELRSNASKVQRNSEKFITAESKLAQGDLRMTRTESIVDEMDDTVEEQREYFDEKFDELKDLLAPLQYHDHDG
tara:strand:+ start:188 stop:571 length:384 start_codon:yes stop_codon:yes gene_type:complete